MPDQNFSRRDVTLSNWRFQPYSRWAFQNAGEIVPSALIEADRQQESSLTEFGTLASLPVSGTGGARVALRDFLIEHQTDAFLVMRKGRFIAEWYAPHYNPARPHIIFSATKSLTGLLAAILVDRGIARYEDRTGDVVPEMRGSAFADATLRQLLDMQASVDFADDHLDSHGDFDRYRRATLWNPEKPGDTASDLLSFLATVSKGTHNHGTRHTYHSISTDMAGIFLETAAGRSFAALMSEYLWRPLRARSDAFVTVDRLGTARAAAGMSTTARDLARVGEMIRVGGAGVVPDTAVKALWNGDRAIWASGDQAWLFKNGSYRSCFYNDGNGCLAGIGIHGQWLWIDPATESVIVRLSSEAAPVDEALDHLVIAMLRAVSVA